MSSSTRPSKEKPTVGILRNGSKENEEVHDPNRRMSGRRPSLDTDSIVPEKTGEMGKRDRQSEGRLSINAVRVRTDLECWLMEQVPKIYESDELPAEINDEKQSDFLSGFFLEGSENDTAVIMSGGEVEQKVSSVFETLLGAKKTYPTWKKDLVNKIETAQTLWVAQQRGGKKSFTQA